MKKFLTVLLALAVMFTFSFGSTVAWADSSEEAWDAALQNAKTYKLAEFDAWAQALVGSLEFNDMGYVGTDLTKITGSLWSSCGNLEADDVIGGYTKAAIEAAIKAVRDDVEANINKAITESKDKKVGNTDASAKEAETAVVSGMTADTTKYNEGDGKINDGETLKAAVIAYSDDLNKAQAPITRSDIERTVAAVDTADYEGASDKYEIDGTKTTVTAEEDGNSGVSVIVAYSSKTKLTATEAVELLKDDITSALKDADKLSTRANQRKAYEKAYTRFKASLDVIKTKADEDFDDVTGNTSLAGAVDNYKQAGYTYAENLLKGFTTSSSKMKWNAESDNSGKGEMKFVQNTANGDYPLQAFWDGDSQTSKSGKLFGVSIANIEKVTRTEAVAVYNAMKSEIDASKVVVTEWADDAGKLAGSEGSTNYSGTVERLYKKNGTVDDTLLLQTLDAAMQAKDMASDVKTEGDKLKAEYRSGVKQYNDAKVEAAVTKAIEFVYHDLTTDVGNAANGAAINTGLKNGAPLTYIALASADIENLGYNKANIEETNGVKKLEALAKLKEDAAKYGYESFKDAVDTAVEKILANNKKDANEKSGAYAKDGAYKGLSKDDVDAAKEASDYVAKKVSYGSDKTPEADLVYLLETYYTGDAGTSGSAGNLNQFADWKDIALDTVDALNKAQSYAEIDSIMEQAAKDFGALLKDSDAADVKTAKEAYAEALQGFIKQSFGLLDSKKADYSKAYGNASTLAVSTSECPLYAKGLEKINDATTVDGVKAAYAEAQALVTGAKSDDELKDIKKAVEAKITALPTTEKLTEADLETVQAAYAAVAEYCDLAGAATTNISNLNDLETKYSKVLEKVKTAYESEAKALWDNMDAVRTQSDADLAKYTAYKAEAQALVDKVAEIDSAVEDIEDDAYLGGNADAVKTAIGYSTESTFEDALEQSSTKYKNIKGALNVMIGNENMDTIYNQEIENAARLLMKANAAGATAAEQKAALDAYNALTERQQLELDQNNSYYYEIAKAIEDKQNTAVKELKLKASSTAKKGSITVKWTVTGDASDIDGYEIWKSTKQSKGFKKTFTTTKTSYKNTKDLKKGTRYYYKVRAYKMVNGVKITSDWSNKANRKAK